MPLQAGQTRLSRIRHAAAPGLLIAALFAGAPSALGAVTISSDATSNMNCSNGVCAPVAKNAVLNVSDLENLLASGNVKVTTTGSGVQAKDIEVKAALSWSSSSTLTLDAYKLISVEKAVSVAGPGGLSVTTNHGGNGGTLLFGEKGSAGFVNLSSQLTINGTAYTLVNSIAQLAGAIGANPAGAYALANDYDASQDGTYANAPIPTTLTGTVEGLGNTISKLSIDHPKGRGGGYFGLFAQVGSGGMIASLKLTGLNFRGRGSQHAGGAIGGLVGLNEGLLVDDHVAGVIAVKRMGVGGLAAGNDNGATISFSSANVRIRAPIAGGLVGANFASTITLSHADGAANGIEAAGLVAENDRGTISESYATGAVTAGDQSVVGGLVGLSENSADISNSYATGAVTGGSNAEVGGFIGEDDNTIEDSYSTGAVAGGTGSLVGGFAGNSEGNDPFTDCYWDSTTSGTTNGVGGTNIAGLTGLTTQQLQSGLPAGFDTKIWNEKSKLIDGLPYLLANPPKK